MRFHILQNIFKHTIAQMGCFSFHMLHNDRVILEKKMSRTTLNILITIALSNIKVPQLYFLHDIGPCDDRKHGKAHIASFVSFK